jgi:pimeloyl-ACP methyl ester carboxylesterase
MLARRLPAAGILLLAACSHGGGEGGGFPSTTIAPSTSHATTTPPALAPDAGTVPIVLIHGITGDPSNFGPLMDRLTPGRTVVRALYAAEADALAPNSLPPDAVVACGYYREHASDTKYTPDAQGLSHGSIGSCPVSRLDGLDVSYYTVSYAARIKRCIEGVKRATGRDRVDLVCHSMGGLVGRAYTHWLSVDASGHCSVRRIFLVASPSRGVNALEALGFGIARTGNQEFMRLGEMVELCYEARIYGGKSFVEQLNGDWDAFCAAHGIRYGGVSAYGGTLDISMINTFLAALPTLSWTQIGASALLMAVLWGDIPRETAEALGATDGTVRIESSRLDEPPFTGADFWSVYQAEHDDEVDSEHGIAQCTFSAEVVRTYLMSDGRLPRGATVGAIDLAPVDAPGRATWLVAHVGDQGPPALAAQLLEETLDSTGAVTSNWTYGCPVAAGDQHLMFPVTKGGGTRRYTLITYGDHGPIGQVAGLVLKLTDGALETTPLATIGAVAVIPGSPGPSVQANFSSNAAPNDPALRYRVRLDGGDWSKWTTQTSYGSPPLAPGIHRVEVTARHSSNAAAMTVDGMVAAGVDLIVRSSGNVKVVR